MIEYLSRQLFPQATAWQLRHPDVVVRFYPAVAGTPDWIEVDSRVGVDELRNGQFLRTPVTAEHAEGITTAFAVHGAVAHVNSTGWRILTALDECTDRAGLTRAWLQSLTKRARRFEPPTRNATCHATVADALLKL